MAWDTAGLLLPPAVARALGEDKNQGPLFLKHAAAGLFTLKPKHATAPIHLTPLDKSVAGHFQRSEPAVPLEPRPPLERHEERRRHGRRAVRRGHDTAASASPAPARESQASRALLHGSRSQSMEPHLRSDEARSESVEPVAQDHLSPFESALNPNVLESMKNNGLMFLDHSLAEPETVHSDVPVPPARVLKAPPPDLGRSLQGAAWRIKSSKLQPSATTADKIYSAPVIPGLPSGRRRGRKLRRPIAGPAPKETRPVSQLELIPEDTPAIILDAPREATPEIINEAPSPEREVRLEDKGLAPVVHQRRPPSDPPPEKKPPRRPSRSSPSPSEDLCAASRAASSVLTMEDAMSIEECALTMEAADVSQDVLSSALAPPVVSKAPSSAMTMEDAASDGEFAVAMQAVDFCEEIWDGALAAQVARNSLASPAPSTWSLCTVNDLVSSELGDAEDCVGNAILKNVFAAAETRGADEKEVNLLAESSAKRALDEGLCWLAEESRCALLDIDIDFDDDDDNDD